MIEADRMDPGREAARGKYRMPRRVLWALFIALAFVATGVVASAFLDVYPSTGTGMLWLTLPVTLLFVAAVLVDLRVAVPRLMVRGHYISYLCAIAALSYAATSVALLMEYAVRSSLHLPHRISDYTSGWILLDLYSNSVMLFFILLGAGVWQFYLKLRDEADAERRLGEGLKAYISTVRERLKPGHIADALDGIGRDIKERNGKAAGEIRRLCDWLRTQLYELPAPPAPSAGTENPAALTPRTAIFAGRRHRITRHLLFQFLLLSASSGTLLVTPDTPDFHGAAGVLSMYLLLNLLAYIDILWLFPRYRKHRSFTRHALEILALSIAAVLPAILAQVFTYDRNLYDKELPLILTISTTIGSFFTIYLFIGGTSALMFCQDWLRGQRRLTLLRAETARQEYAFLKKQINPHFLFNVLNNIGILSEEEPEEAEDMLARLRTLIDYQFGEAESGTTTVGREVRFLATYLSLAQSRIESLRYEIDMEEGASFITVPTLLFIPFVENAVKHSAPLDGERRVEISFFRGE